MDEDRRGADSPSAVDPSRPVAPYFLAAIAAAILVWALQQQWVQDSGPPADSHRSSDNGARPEADTPQPAAGDLRTLFSGDDYPAEAQRNGEEGTVQAELSVDERGRVTSCTVIRSSTHRSLDEATCGIVRRRARFNPARDVNGDAVASKITTPPIVWRLEG